MFAISKDNIIGVAGIGKVKAHNAIINLLEEDKMYETVLEYYFNEDLENGLARFEMNADCLWIWRTLGINFTLRDCN